MKLAGAAQAELVKWLMIGGGLILAAWWIKSQAGAAATAVGDALSNAADAVKRDVKGQMGKPVPDFNGAHADVSPLLDYFNTYGQTTATRNEARKAGWTDADISMAVMLMNTEDPFIYG